MHYDNEVLRFRGQLVGENAAIFFQGLSAAADAQFRMFKNSLEVETGLGFGGELASDFAGDLAERFRREIDEPATSQNLPASQIRLMIPGRPTLSALGLVQMVRQSNDSQSQVRRIRVGPQRTYK